MSVELQALWTLHGTPDGPRSVYFRGYPAGAGALTDAIGGELNLADRPLSDVPPRARRAAEALWREVIERSIPATPIELEGTLIPITGPEHVTHFATARFAGSPVDASVVKWDREPRTLDGRAVGSTQEVTVAVAELSAAARGAIHALNGLARELLAGRYSDVVRAMARGAPPALELRRVKGFLSYRSPHKPLARRLHDAIEAYGHGRHFDIYLDEHERELGGLRAQLAREIDQRPLFLIACTSDYAGPDSVSEFEFRHADEQRRHGAVQFAPVIFGEPRDEIWQILEPLVRLRVGPDSDFGDERFDDMLRTVLGSVDAT